MDPLIYKFSTSFQKKLCSYHGINCVPVSSTSTQFKVDGFNEYNYLIDINHIFSSSPSGDIVDRTSSVVLPFNMFVHRPWKNNHVLKTLEKCFEDRVRYLEKQGPINLFWSGGIDSTSVLVAFLKHSKKLDQVRVLYSTYSVKENPNFYLHLLNIPDIEMVEISGDYYLDQNLDGIFISGDGIDDLTASLDESFIKKHSWQYLQMPWQDLYYKSIKDDKFLEFCEKFNELSNRPIKTVLEARWWFYTNCKIQKFPIETSSILNDHQPLAVGFFDNYDFEHYMSHNIEKIMPEKNYQSYKQIFKDYIFEYDHDKRYRTKKKKTSSLQLPYYTAKKLALKNTNYILLLSNGQRIRTQNLPLLSEREYRNTYRDSLNYLFNTH